MRTIIFPYKMGSASARMVAEDLDGLRVRPQGRYTPRSGDFVINWGASIVPAWYERLLALTGTRLLNHPRNVGNAANKLNAFRILQQAGVSIPVFTTDMREAAGWIRQGNRVFGRDTLTGHSGQGIRVFSPHPTVTTDWLPETRMYVREIRNHGEYRVHVMNGQVIDYIKKRRRNGERANQEQLDVRNLANGWVYTRDNLRRLERIEQLAVNAVAALGLDFGAVDIIKNENGEVFVLEVNTACGMSDTTRDAYASAFGALIDSHANRTN